MSQDLGYQDWRELRKKIQIKFEKLNDLEIDRLHNHMDRLTNLIKRVYSYSQARAEQESRSFSKSLLRR